MPGPEALRKREYYGFEGNHFWRILTDVLSDNGARERVPRLSYADKVALLKENHVALWDVIRSCERTGASDSSIRAVKPNRLIELLKKYPNIGTLFLNGRTAEALYRKHFGHRLRIAAHYLPSTSPAHAAMSYEKKLKKWGVITAYLSPKSCGC